MDPRPPILTSLGYGRWIPLLTSLGRGPQDLFFLPPLAVDPKTPFSYLPSTSLPLTVASGEGRRFQPVIIPGKRRKVSPAAPQRCSEQTRLATPEPMFGQCRDRFPRY
ncbi:hypothetical protein RRG08_038640 [Elysia crispata]|uniref:Uncharacterized protein n=1 Tax=Elysia crispata TaxID=231223 RepID=A0AAE0YMG1_9GAST|nr:hypothetical protein RRG08_038640 [Elysia crispata]